MAAEPPRPQDGSLPITLYGKTADLIRAESASRQMGHDQLLRDIIWCWYLDLEKARRQRPHPADVRD